MYQSVISDIVLMDFVSIINTRAHPCPVHVWSKMCAVNPQKEVCIEAYNDWLYSQFIPVTMTMFTSSQTWDYQNFCC